MNSIRKCSIKQHGSTKKNPSARTRPVARWQSYLLASVMVIGFFVFTQSVMAESQPKSEPLVRMAQTPRHEETSPPTPEKLETEILAKAPIPPSTDEATPTLEDTENSAPLQEAATTIPLEEAPLGPIQEDSEFAAAESVVTGFYQELDSGDFDQAYDRLSPDFRESLSFSRFHEGYSSTSGVKCTVQSREKIDDHLVRFNISISVSENGHDSEYYATCLVKKLDNAWCLDGVGQVRG